MRRDRAEQLRAIRPLPVLLLATTSIGIVLLGYEAPLTFDEAFNRVAFANLSTVGILRTYSFANNHVPFTVLQSFIPPRLLAWNPWTIRVLSIASGVAMTAVLIGVAAVRRTTPLLGVLLVCGSPLLVTYLFLARGYTFSAIFLVVAAAMPVMFANQGSVRPVYIGAVALAFGTWPIPTNGFVMPGWIIGVLALWGFRTALAGTAIYAAAITVLFAPIAGQLYTQEKLLNLHEHWWPWLGEISVASSLVPACLGLVALATVGLITLRSRPTSLVELRALDRSSRLALLTAAMSMSWFVFLGLAHAVVGLHLPFVRTAVPSLWLAAVAIVAAFPRGRLEYAAVALLIPGVVLSALLWTRAVRNGDWEHVSQASRNDVLYATTPATIRDLRSLRADRIDCVGYDAPICKLVSPFLSRQGITVETGTGKAIYNVRLPCAIGSHRPPVPWQVNVYREDRLLGVLCH